MKRRANENSWNTAQVLSEALPFIQRHAERTIVVKFGGNAMGDEELTQQFANDIVLLRQCGLRPVVVHGGGPQIGSMLKRLDIKSEFVDGLRVTDMETVGVAEMVLSGAINKSIVAAINQAGGRAVGFSGRDAGLITAEAVNADLGFTGHPIAVDPLVIHTLANARPGFIPVISPISGGKNGESFNVNADTAAGVIAGALNAARLMLLTDIEGVMDANKNLLTDLSIRDARGLIEDGTANGGMIPKLNTAIDAIEDGVEAVVILDGRRAHGLLVELFTDMGAGTLIR
ncbi:N-acetylglutamate kinase [Litorimonas taeanensis]|uniref:Acetylglutamate kinase n=1 Tax=Litorimonas taeanensis TaxID=568099 RepID=A0A420WDZ8_9PROT|nr:acetylglutamate kinase [Litorimonas taeanensis]RKQ69241.1 N-acetylglutamate kinase [Litorimonas taeanensis]